MFKGIIIIILLMAFGCSKEGKDNHVDKGRVGTGRVGKGKVFDLCDFPNSIKQAIVRKLNKKCESVLLEDIIEITHLKITNLSEQNVKLLSKQYAMYFLTLEDLDISENPNMLTLPEFVVYLPRLKKLNISRTGVSTFSQNISQLSTLTTLIASHNNYKYQEPPLAVFDLVNLQVLDMSYSSIRYIDEYLYKLENLEELYLAGSQLMVVPYMLQLMPKLLLIDLSDNNLDPYADLLEENAMLDQELNTLHTCKGIENASDRKSCQEDMLDSFSYQWWYKLPFKRGKPFRRYKEMTDEEFAAFTAAGELPSKNRCYLWWLNSYFIPLTEHERIPYLEHTINGKTRRELKILLTERVKAAGPAAIYPMFRFNEYKMLYADTAYASDSQEVFPDDYYSENWHAYPIDCKQDIHLYTEHPLYEEWVKQLEVSNE